MSLSASLFIIFFSGFTASFTMWFIWQILFMNTPFKGIIPRRLQILSPQIAHYIKTQIFTENGIREKLSGPAVMQKILPEVETHIDIFLKDKIKTVFPLLAGLIGEKTRTQLKSALMKELEALIPQLLNNYINTLENDPSTEKMIAEKIGALPNQQINPDIKKHLSSIYVKLLCVAAGIGLVMGLVQVGLFMVFS